MAGEASVTPGRWIAMGWNLVRADLGNFLLLTLIAVALATVGSFLVAGPLTAGLFIATRRKMLEGRADFGDLFAGFNVFIDSFLIFILSFVFSMIGLALCLLPVLIVTALYLFPYLFLIDRKLSFWDAMEASRKLAANNVMGYIVFVVLLLLLNLLGLVLAGVGVLITIPISIAAVAIAYQEVVGFAYKPVESHGPVVIE